MSRTNHVKEALELLAKLIGEEYPGTHLYQEYSKIHDKAVTALEDGLVLPSKESRQVLQALIGPGHHIRELQFTMTLPDNPVVILLNEYNTVAAEVEAESQAERERNTDELR